MTPSLEELEAELRHSVAVGSRACPRGKSKQVSQGSQSKNKHERRSKLVRQCIRTFSSLTNLNQQRWLFKTEEEARKKDLESPVIPDSMLDWEADLWSRRQKQRCITLVDALNSISVLEKLDSTCRRDDLRLLRKCIHLPLYRALSSRFAVHFSFHFHDHEGRMFWTESLYRGAQNMHCDMETCCMELKGSDISEAFDNAMRRKYQELMTRLRDLLISCLGVKALNLTQSNGNYISRQSVSHSGEWQRSTSSPFKAKQMTASSPVMSLDLFNECQSIVQEGLMGRDHHSGNRNNPSGSSSRSFSSFMVRPNQLSCELKAALLKSYTFIEGIRLLQQGYKSFMRTFWCVENGWPVELMLGVVQQRRGSNQSREILPPDLPVAALLMRKDVKRCGFGPYCGRVGIMFTPKYCTGVGSNRTRTV